MHNLASYQGLCPSDAKLQPITSIAAEIDKILSNRMFYLLQMLPKPRPIVRFLDVSVLS